MRTWAQLQGVIVVLELQKGVCCRYLISYLFSAYQKFMLAALNGVFPALVKYSLPQDILGFKVMRWGGIERSALLAKNVCWILFPLMLGRAVTTVDSYQCSLWIWHSPQDFTLGALFIPWSTWWVGCIFIDSIIQMKTLRHRKGKVLVPCHIARKWQHC